jgi:23S rRNA (guanosine2251-2'-O)-methyltransferase
MVIWGRNPVMEALRSGRDIEKIFIAHDSHPPKALLRLAKERGVKLQKVPRAKVEELAQTKKTQGIVALLSPIRYLPPEEVFRITKERNSFFIVPDHITDPQNLGSLLRSCEVFGGAGAILPKDRCSPINEVVVKSSAGAVFHLAISRVSNLANSLREFKKIGGWVFSVERGGRDISSLDIPTPCCLVLGSEGEGVSKKLLELSDSILSIPMGGRISSLNVGVAGAIAMWEIYRRQRCR